MLLHLSNCQYLCGTALNINAVNYQKQSVLAWIAAVTMRQRLHSSDGLQAIKEQLQCLGTLLASPQLPAGCAHSWLAPAAVHLPSQRVLPAVGR